MIRTPLLILDDMGKTESGKRLDGELSSAFVRDAYWQIIDGRYQAQLPIVVTSNFPATVLTDYLGQPSAERLIEMTWQNVVRLKGKSQRIPEARVKEV
jgi:DNA replication protein DnaC